MARSASFKSATSAERRIRTMRDDGDDADAVETDPDPGEPCTPHGNGW